MKLIFKIILGAVLTLTIFVVLVIFLMPMIYDTEDLKHAVVTGVKEQTGRELAINGDLNLSVFPYLSIEVNDLSLGNAEGFGAQSFASISLARVGVAR